MTIPIWLVDAFAERPFTGNPAAVCVLSSYPSDRWMQNVAMEMNLSETAFVVPTKDAGGFHLRWFTPATEVDLCGHATLAAAHTLFEQSRVEADQPIRFQTRSGELTSTRLGTTITLDFPATPPTVVDLDRDPSSNDPSDKRIFGKIHYDKLLVALGIAEATILQSTYDLLVVVEHAGIVDSLHPNFIALAEIDTRGVMVSAAGGAGGVDFVSRFFAPQCGINEDPVTGSAHCCLAPYWADRLGKTSLVGYQASPRGGMVACEVARDRVHLTGTAVTVLEGRLLSEPT